MLSRGFAHGVDGVPEPLFVDSWAITRAEHRSVDIEIYVPSVTDATDRPELLLARASVSRDGAEPRLHWLDYRGQIDNNYRFQWDLSGEDLLYTPWDELTYFFELSTDGVNWHRVGLDEGPDALLPRTITRAEDWCPSTYWGDWCE